MSHVRILISAARKCARLRTLAKIACAVTPLIKFLTALQQSPPPPLLLLFILNTRTTQVFLVIFVFPLCSARPPSPIFFILCPIQCWLRLASTPFRQLRLLLLLLLLGSLKCRTAIKTLFYNLFSYTPLLVFDIRSRFTHNFSIFTGGQFL